MNFNRKTKWEFIKKFINLCEENNIWYSLDNYSLLGLKRHGGFVPWVEKFQVFMTDLSYEKLAKLFPKNVLDSSKNPKIRSYKSFFVEDYNDWKKKQDFAEIRIAVPTSVKKVLKFKGNLLNNLFKRNYDLKVAINKLYEEKYEGFYLLDNDKKTNKLWISNLSFEREKGSFGSINVQFIKEWNKVLISQFGENYMEATLPEQYYIYEKPLEKKLVEN